MGLEGGDDRDERIFRATEVRKAGEAISEQTVGQKQAVNRLGDIVEELSNGQVERD